MPHTQAKDSLRSVTLVCRDLCQLATALGLRAPAMDGIWQTMGQSVGAAGAELVDLDACLAAAQGAMEDDPAAGQEHLQTTAMKDDCLSESDLQARQRCCSRVLQQPAEGKPEAPQQTERAHAARWQGLPRALHQNPHGTSAAPNLVDACASTAAGRGPARVAAPLQGALRQGAGDEGGQRGGQAAEGLRAGEEGILGGQHRGPLARA